MVAGYFFKLGRRRERLPIFFIL